MANIPILGDVEAELDITPMCWGPPCDQWGDLFVAIVRSSPLIMGVSIGADRVLVRIAVPVVGNLQSIRDEIAYIASVAWAEANGWRWVASKDQRLVIILSDRDRCELSVK